MFKNWIKITFKMCWFSAEKRWDSRLGELSRSPLNILISWTFYIENKTMLISTNLMLSSAITNDSSYDDKQWKQQKCQLLFFTPR